MKGTYVLLLNMGKNSEIRIGGLGVLDFGKGYYAYVGSGQGSLEKRLERHFSDKKKRFWHIDYLLGEAEALGAVYFESGKEECRLAGGLAENFDSVKGFGCSDCSCMSHLFFSPDRKILEKKVISTVRSLQGLPLRWPRKRRTGP